MSLRLPHHLKELRFLQLAVYTLIFVTIFPLLSDSHILDLLAQIFLLNSLLVSISAGGPKSRLNWILWQSLHIIFTGLLLLSCVIVIFAFIFLSHQVTLDTIFAAVVAYLFIAFTYAELYRLIWFWQPGSFLFPSQDPASFHVFQGDMVYFSLVTIATVGYGDIAPKMPMPRMLAAVEGVIGQFYVAILVAWLVGIFISNSLRSKQPENNQ
jgi:voltage-gated potassium channel